MSAERQHADRVRYRFSPLERRGVIAGWRGGQIASVAVEPGRRRAGLRSRPSVVGVALATGQRRIRRGPGVLAHPRAHRRAVASPGGPMGVVGIVGEPPPTGSPAPTAAIWPRSCPSESGSPGVDIGPSVARPRPPRSPDGLRRCCGWSGVPFGAAGAGAGDRDGGRRARPVPPPPCWPCAATVSPSSGRATRTRGSRRGPGCSRPWPERDPTSTGSNGSSPVCPTTGARCAATGPTMPCSAPTRRPGAPTGRWSTRHRR